MYQYLTETKQKLCISGLILEKFQFLDHSLGYGVKMEWNDPKRPAFSHSSPDPKITAEYNAHQRIKRFKRLINSNVGVYRRQNPFNISNSSFYPPVFTGMTYKDQHSDYSKAKVDFGCFVERLNSCLDTDLKYLAVPEPHKTGNAHLHTLFFNLPFIHWKNYESLWSWGSINIKKVDEVKDLGDYMGKYLTKSFNFRERGKKSFISSRGLKQPVLIYDQEKAETIMDNLPPRTEKLFEREYLTKWNGRVKYSEYKLSEPLSLDLVS